MSVRVAHYSDGPFKKTQNNAKIKEVFSADVVVIKRKNGRATVIEVNGERYILDRGNFK